MLIKIITLSLVFTCFVTWSNTVTNDSDTSQRTEFLEVGNAKFSVMFWDIYDSRLYTTTGAYPVELTNEHIAFEVTYLRDIDKDDLITRTLEQWEHIGLSKEKYAHYIPSLESMWPDIKAGDTLRLLMEQSNSHFYFNQTYIGSIESDEFGQQFIDIWLSPKTSQPKLRAQLLGYKNHD